ncbi:MAG: TPM domain-containing protein, partial [bacterium]
MSPARGACSGWIAGLLAATLLCLAPGAAAPAQDIPTPRGFVTDTAGVIDPTTAGNLDRLLTELQQKTGAAIAVLTVPSTAPL